jgi:hypothetical protein
MKQVSCKKNIYVGFNDYYKFIVCKEYNGAEVFKFERFDKLKTILSHQSFNRICNSIEGIKEFTTLLPSVYGIKDGLPLYFYLNDRYLIIISTGETQPSLYEIYLEGVWKLEEEDLINV